MLFFDYQITSADELAHLNLDQFYREEQAVYGIIRLQIGVYQKDLNEEILNYWLENLLDMLIHFQQGGTFAAFREIETPAFWILCKKAGTFLTVCHAEEPNVSISGKKYDLLQQIQESWLTAEDHRIVEKTQCRISFASASAMIQLRVKRFLDEIMEINPILRYSNLYVLLEQKLRELGSL